MITVGISDMGVVRADDTLVTYALGSCVGICLYDSINKIAGLSHIMLPSSKMSTTGGNMMRFADTAIPMLIHKMVILGAKSTFIKAKIAGGAKMFAMDNNSSIANIGDRNVIAVKEALLFNKISIIAEDTGSDYGRTLYFDGAQGIMKIKSAKQGEHSF